MPRNRQILRVIELLERKGRIKIDELGIDQQLFFIDFIKLLAGSEATFSPRRVEKMLSGDAAGRYGVLVTRRVARKSGAGKVLKSPVPRGGNFRRLIQPEGPAMSRSLSATAHIVSTQKSGRLRARVAFRPALQSVSSDGALAQFPAQFRFWETDSGLASLTVVRDSDPAVFQHRVLLDAYAGDLYQLILSDWHYVNATHPTHHQFDDFTIPLYAGSNVIARLTMPAGLRRLMPADHILFGQYGGMPVTGSAQLRTLPQFPLRLGYIALADAYLAITTDFDDGVADAIATVNGVLELFGARLPMSSSLCADDGILSFNLATDKAPLQTDLRALAPLAGGAAYLDAWGEQGRALLNNVTQYRLDAININYDVGNPGLISVGFGIECGNALSLAYETPRLEARLTGYRLEWLIGWPGGRPGVTVEGAGQASIVPFDGAVWEAAIESYPELCVRCWAGADQLPLERLVEWLRSVGSAPFFVASYCGCLIKLYPGRMEVYVGDDGQDFPRVI